MTLFSLADLEAALQIVRAVVPPTPQYAWPLLAARTGVTVIAKHENHTPIGAFKVRGGLVYADRLKRRQPHVKGVVTATRGNHGQSFAFALSRAGVPITLVVPHGNSVEKNAAMRAFGAERIVEVTDDEIAEAMRALFSDTHCVAEGAGAAAFAALTKERACLAGKRCAVIISGQNIDRPWMQTVLAGGTPQVA